MNKLSKVDSCDAGRVYTMEQAYQLVASWGDSSGKVSMAEFDPVEFSRTEDFEDDVPYEERLKVGMRIQRGIEDVEAGRVYTVEQVRKHLGHCPISPPKHNDRLT